LAAELSAVPGEDHETVPQPGSAYSMGGANTGLPADLRWSAHYPVEAICLCGEMIRCERDLRLSPGDPGDWVHLGRKPGEP
jgi:hypothetical protein